MLLQLALDAVGGRTHTGLEVVPAIVDHIPIDHRRLAAGRACRQAIAGAPGRGIVLIDAQDGHSHSENKAKQDWHGEPPSQAKNSRRNAHHETPRCDNRSPEGRGARKASTKSSRLANICAEKLSYRELLRSAGRYRPAKEYHVEECHGSSPFR